MDGITGAQIRMARSLLRWSAAELAARSGVGVSTVKRAEAADGVPIVHKPNLAALRLAMEAAGVEFLADGVRPATPGAGGEKTREAEARQAGMTPLPMTRKPGATARNPRQAASPIAKHHPICQSSDMTASHNFILYAVSGRQVRAARALIGMTREDLSGASGVPARTIARWEDGEGGSRRGTMAAIVTAFEAAGIEFIAENGGGPGVRLRKPAGG